MKKLLSIIFVCCSSVILWKFYLALLVGWLIATTLIAASKITVKVIKATYKVLNEKEKIDY